ncbi:MAG: hypothetical protein K2R98_30655 [Gemmataceae bacterium]|nr:hypothetical protein [Gemmataceae bacterium]
MSSIVKEPAASAATEVRPEPITQAMLEECQALIQATARRVALRQQIVDRLDAGATIDDGRLTALIHEHSDHRFTYHKLVALLGEVRVAELKLQVEPTLNRQLVVLAVSEEELDNRAG